MAKKKRATSKLAKIVTDVENTSDLPSIQIEDNVSEATPSPITIDEQPAPVENDEQPTPEIFLDSSENLEGDPVDDGPIILPNVRANPPFRVFEGFIKGIWGNLGVERIARMNSGFTLVSFRDAVTRDLLLETGVIHFDKKPVILRPWTADMDAERIVKSVPVCVRLNGLGLQYWGRNNLSALVSTIGKPIMVDKVTLSRTMIKYARVLVDIEISDCPPKTIAYINERKQLPEQTVEYEWLPSKCGACGLL
ncbi:uncharacterized protein LOC133034204 [Cannabis sativa]|uniref:uncharacterized protein LOC133034204 n=1 Tax=Cannabis sativa TaxID=3483 RepID=UPI0029C9CD0B|nr:uncharacterized protein LOC133034204 [Cannabis sativa]